MIKYKASDTRVVTGPLGEKMSVFDIPPPETTRWVARRKAEVVAAVEGGLLSPAEACERYQLSLEELFSWQRAVAREGLTGLKARSIQRSRKDREERGS